MYVVHYWKKKKIIVPLSISDRYHSHKNRVIMRRTLAPVGSVGRKPDLRVTILHTFAGSKMDLLKKNVI